MTLPASRRARDLRLSVTRRIGDSLTVTSPSQTGGAPVTRVVPVYHSAPWSDPDSMGAPAGTQEPAWIGTTWIADGAGSYAYSVLQIDIYTRQLADNDPKSDAFGLFNADVTDAVWELFAGLDASGRPRAYVQIMDFTNPAAPVVPPDGEGGYMVCQPPGGAVGTAMDRRSLGRLGQQWRTTVRLAFRTMTDAARRPGTTPDTPRG